jgi:hypothetical protein
MSNPKKADELVWRQDGEEEQIIVLSKDGFSLPIILNPTAAKIFLLCDGNNSLEDIAGNLCDEFNLDDFSLALSDVQQQIKDFTERGIIKD